MNTVNNLLRKTLNFRKNKKEESPTQQYCITQSNRSAMVLQHVLKNNFSYKEPILITNKFQLKNKPTINNINLSKGANKILQIPNAGGTSTYSEAISFDILNTMFDAQLEATEMELEYFPLNSKITDFSIRINDRKFGVSVTRGMKYNGRFTYNDGERLLTKKLTGVNCSSENVTEKFKWDKQILHILAENEYTASLLEEAYENLSNQLKSDTVVIITVCENCPWVFYEGNCR